MCIILFFFAAGSRIQPSAPAPSGTTAKGRRLGGIPTIGAAAAATFAAGPWCGGPDAHTRLVRQLSVGRPDEQVKALLMARDVFEELDRDNDGEPML